MALSVVSGITTIVSGAPPTGRPYITEAIAVNLFGIEGNAVSSYSGALNVNISGGSVSVSISGGVTTSIPGLQSGTLIEVSGGVAALSGLYVMPIAPQSGTAVVISGVALTSTGLNVYTVSGDFINVASASGNKITDYSGALNVNISGGTVSASFTPPSPQSGQYVMLSGGFAGISGLPVTASVATTPFSPQSGQYVMLSGGFAGVSGLPVTGAVVVSGGVAISGLVGVSGGVAGLSGLYVMPSSVQSGQYVMISGGQLGISGANVLTSVSGNYVGVTSGSIIPTSPVSGNVFPVFYASGEAGSGTISFLNVTQAKLIVSGAAVVTVKSGLGILQSVIPTYISGGAASFSGQYILVMDAVSGMSIVGSGTPVYNFDFGAHSGNIVGTPGAYPPMMVGANIVCYSGITVHGAAGLTVTIGYA